MRIPREFVDLLSRFYDVAHERGVLTPEQTVFELRIAAGRAAADAIALTAEHADEPDPIGAVALFVARFAPEALRDGVIDLDQVVPITALLDETAAGAATSD
jgi:hypothetical protein